VVPELAEQEEHACGERQGAEKGSDAHAERQLLRAHVAVDVVGLRKSREQPVVVAGDRLALCVG
jgi:hypothetical protein